MNRQDLRSERFSSVVPSPCRGRVAWLGVVIAAAAQLASSSPAAAQAMKEEVKDRVEQATVMVFTAVSRNSKGDTPLSSGSGFFINSTGLFVTNNHVVDPTHGQSDEQKQRFHYEQGRLTWTAIVSAGTDEEQTYEATVIYQNETADQALAQAYDEDGDQLETPDYLPFLPEERLAERMKVWALGFPGGDRQRTSSDKHPEVSITVGNVLQAPRTPGGRVRMVYTDVIARPGNSGGPMVNADGYLVGTVTLMTKPEGREDSGGANFSALVPAKLTKMMVQNAYKLDKMPPHTDFLPFIDVLADATGRINIPEYARQRKQDVLFFDNGDRVYGKFGGKTVSWDGPIGTVEVPITAIAYVMHDDEEDDASSLVLEGGNQIRGQLAEDTFAFTPEGGEEREQDTEGLVAIGFRTSKRGTTPFSGKVVVFDSDLSHLVLCDVKGDVKITGRAGTVTVPLEEIDRIDVSSDDEDLRVLTLSDGRRITGEFEESEIQAKIAATGTPITFNLGEVSHATIQVQQLRRDQAAGLDLLGVLGKADRDIMRIARDLQQGNNKTVRPRLNELLEPSTFKRLPGVDREQVALLDGVSLLREGKYAAASKRLRKLKRSSNLNVSAYAQACTKVVKRYGKEFEGKPLSDVVAFAAAGGALADELLENTRDFLKDTRLLTGSKGEYASGMTAAKKHGKAMRVAAVFNGTEADDELVRVWKFATDVCQREIQRLDREIADAGSSNRGSGRRAAPRRRGRGRSRAGGGAQLRLQREVDNLQTKREKVIDDLRKYRMMRGEYGFRIEDPDIRQFAERRAQDSGGGDYDDEP